MLESFFSVLGFVPINPSLLVSLTSSPSVISFTLAQPEENLCSISIIGGLQFSSNGKTIAAIVGANNPNHIVAWSLDKPEIVTMGGKGFIAKINFSPYGNLITSANFFADKTIDIWNTDGKKVQTLDNGILTARARFTPRGTILALNFGKLNEWDVNGNKLQSLEIDYRPIVNRFRLHEENISPNLKFIATVEDNSGLKLLSWDGKSIKLLKKDSTNKPLRVAFSRDSEYLAFGAINNSVEIWSTDSLEERVLKGHSGRVSLVVFSPDGKTLASSSDDKTIKLWSIDGKELFTFDKFTSSVTGIDFSPDSQSIVTSNEDGTVKLWNVNGKELRSFPKKCPLNSDS